MLVPLCLSWIPHGLPRDQTRTLQWEASDHLLGMWHSPVGRGELMWVQVFIPFMYHTVDSVFVRYNATSLGNWFPCFSRTYCIHLPGLRVRGSLDLRTLCSFATFGTGFLVTRCHPPPPFGGGGDPWPYCDEKLMTCILQSVVIYFWTVDVVLKITFFLSCWFVVYYDVSVHVWHKEEWRRNCDTGTARLFCWAAWNSRTAALSHRIHCHKGEIWIYWCLLLSKVQETFMPYHILNL